MLGFPTDFDKTGQEGVMGGLLSGGADRKHRGTIEEYRRIDAGLFFRKGALRPGYAGTVSWTSANGKDHQIGFRAEDRSLRLQYAYRRGEDAWRQIDQVVPVIRRQCRLGGGTALFLCPGCSAIRKHLYGSQAEFLCRKCSGLTYSTQREREYDRAARRARKLRRRIGADLGLGDWVGTKPKHMHHRTFDAIVEQIHAREEVAEMQLVHVLQRLQRIERRLPSRKAKAFWS
ncbi:hypothetical protein HY17_18845 [Hyphomonas sp. CY54-11-8]|nr:hypothetical protein HY17_18845 [Hyphomonas sp. CY54-11-8]